MRFPPGWARKAPHTSELTDIYDPADDNNTVVGTDFFVVVRLKEAVDFYIAIF